jgi:ligand-binding sensor domain-containing protein/two-component sensor histidine kinase
MRKFLIILCLLASPALFAQQYGFIQYTASDGLAQSQVNCLYQDSLGYIWCGTLGGLSKFDGRKFTSYSQQHGLPGNQITCIAEDGTGRMLLGLPGALAILDQGEITAHHLPEGFEEKQVNDIVMDGERIWLCTSAGMLAFDKGEFSTLPVDHVASKGHVKRLFERNGAWVYAMREQIVAVSESGSEVLFAPEEGHYIFDVELDSNGDLWIACKDQGVVKLRQDGSVMNLNMAAGLLSSTITHIEIDSEGKLWLSSEHGLAMYDGEEFHNYTEKNGLPINQVNVSLCDREKNVWIGTAGAGLIKFAGETFVSYTTEHGLCGNGVLGITQDLDGQMWFSSYEGEICYENDGAFTAFEPIRDGLSNQYWSSLCDSQGTMWFGSANGLIRVKDGKARRFTQAEGLKHRKVLSLLEGADGTIYIGTSKGLNYILEDDPETLQLFEALPKIRVRGMEEGRNGELWLATNQGVYLIDNENITTYSTEEKLSSSNTYCVQLDGQNRLWVGTNNGLNLIDQGNVSRLSIDMSFGANVINFLQEVDGDMYIGTNSGLFRGEEIDSGFEFENFGLHHGLVSLETNLNAVYLDDEKRLWFGTAAGLVRVETSEVGSNKNALPPSISIDQIKVNLADQNWRNTEFDLDPRTGQPLDFKVGHKANNLSFYFTGVSTSNPDAVKYQYMLAGYDDDWQPTSNEEYVHYRNLPFDSFEFMVKAIGESGLSSSIQTVKVSIAPPFWLTWWFLLLSVVVITSIVLRIFQGRRRALINKHDKERFEYKSKMLSLEQQSLNSSMNRHFIFNALNSIQYYINRQDRISANKYLSAFARLIRKNLDSSQTNVTSLREEIERLELYLQLEHMRFQDKFEYKIEVEDGIDQDMIKVPAMLLQPFLENSIWHGILPNQKPGIINVTISRSTRSIGSIEFCVKDNGIGIDTSLSRKLDQESHVSKGMTITSGRIELIKKMTGESVELHGPYELRDDQDVVSGTEVKIILPVNFHEIYPN